MLHWGSLQARAPGNLRLVSYSHFSVEVSTSDLTRCQMLELADAIVDMRFKHVATPVLDTACTTILLECYFFSSTLTAKPYDVDVTVPTDSAAALLLSISLSLPS